MDREVKPQQVFGVSVGLKRKRIRVARLDVMSVELGRTVGVSERA